MLNVIGFIIVATPCILFPPLAVVVALAWGFHLLMERHGYLPAV